MRLSVIVANYNNREYLSECLDSIIGQTYKDLDIVVYDDASTDSSQDVIRQYEREHPGVVKGIYGPVNLGVARARHEAILHTESECISTLDSDDYYIEEKKLETEMKILEYHRKKGRDAIVFSDIIRVDAEGNVIGPQWAEDKIREGDLLECILTRTCMIPRDFVMPRAAYFTAGGYDFKIPIYEDWDLKIRLAKKYAYYFTGAAGSAYRRHGKGLSAAPVDEHIEWLEYIFYKNIRLADAGKKEKLEQAFKVFIEPFKKQASQEMKLRDGNVAMRQPLVTVVTVVLNDPEGLERTVKSVLEQTYDNLEYIIIDGGSGPATIEMIKRYEGGIDRWISESDNGIYDAMNKGIDLATGEWINFMNAGDRFFDQDVIANVFHQDFGDADFIYGHSNFLGGDFKGIVKAWGFDLLWKTMIFTHQSSFTRTDLLRYRKFDTSFKICADYDVIFDSYMAGRKFHHADIVISTLAFGISEANRAKMAVEKWKVVKRYRKDLGFHFFYLTLVVRRFFRDLKTRLLQYRSTRLS